MGMNKLIQKGTLLSVSPTQWNTRIVIDIPGEARRYYGEYEWDIPGEVMSVDSLGEVQPGTELLIEGYVKLSLGKDKGDGRPPFVFKNLIATKIVASPSQDLSEWDTTADNSPGEETLPF